MKTCFLIIELRGQISSNIDIITLLCFGKTYGMINDRKEFFNSDGSSFSIF